jgi:hypothetical protein
MGFLVLFSPEGGDLDGPLSSVCSLARDGRAETREFGALFIDTKYSLGAELGALCY